MSTNDLIKKMNKSRDVQPTQLNSSPTLQIGELEVDITNKVEDIVERLLVERELIEVDQENTNIEYLRAEIRALNSTVGQLKEQYKIRVDSNNKLLAQVEELLTEIKEVKEKKKSKWKGLFK